MTSSHEAGSYERAGVDYETLDAAKRSALAAALGTSALPGGRATMVDASRGEPATVLRVGDTTLGFVLECLGTKSQIARAYEEVAGVDRFAAIGYDTVAAAVNDLVCVGALPVVVNAYFATGAAEWYRGTRHESLVNGFRDGCVAASAAWGGGESPTLSGLVDPEGIDLAASAIGVVPPGSSAPWLGAALAPGDEIVLVASTGLHANGASLARAVTGGLTDGLRHRLPSGRELGDALLDPTAIYVRLVAALVDEHVPVSYVSHITGHGWRKLMRADRALGYSIDTLPEVPEVLRFLADAAGMGDRESYGTFNMGAGLAVYCRPGSGGDVVDAAKGCGMAALVAGEVVAGPRRVVIAPLGIEYEAGDLDLR
ncbi:MAG TPA: AIR synthase-related protein [Acidimicrobiales bacterium]|nr:AIR synthase-related protein [Acidimicrobiales bacterium]